MLIIALILNKHNNQNAPVADDFRFENLTLYKSLRCRPCSVKEKTEFSAYIMLIRNTWIMALKDFAVTT